MNDCLDVPAVLVERVREACAHLPEAYEEQASHSTVANELKHRGRTAWNRG